MIARDTILIKDGGRWLLSHQAILLCNIKALSCCNSLSKCLNQHAHVLLQ